LNSCNSIFRIYLSRIIVETWIANCNDNTMIVITILLQAYASWMRHYLQYCDCHMAYKAIELLHKWKL